MGGTILAIAVAVSVVAVVYREQGRANRYYSVHIAPIDVVSS